MHHVCAIDRVAKGPDLHGRVGTHSTVVVAGKAGHRIGTGRFDRVVDRYRDELDRNYRDGGSIPSRPTIYRDRTGTDRNGTGWDKRDGTYSYFKK
ncbi:hypothetical protein H5410_035518 [Solanum commersonii]|uniref:Uncharacterized protein n=1 Tax=Solanum commersonii TaxID=4109 RepID=A0A9J5Y5D8_SOLCO|nr:hypothetical protein H5410_035518 [Solanum commersonii]